MNNVDTPELWLVAAIGLVLGLALGALITYLLQQRGGGNTTAAALKTELDDYQRSVNEHFEKTADLFQDLTDKYRDVYEHLAEGANSLAKRDADAPALELVRHGLLTASTAAESAAEIAPEDAELPTAAPPPDAIAGPSKPD